MLGLQLIHVNLWSLVDCKEVSICKLAANRSGLRTFNCKKKMGKQVFVSDAVLSCL